MYHIVSNFFQLSDFITFEQSQNCKNCDTLPFGILWTRTIPNSKQIHLYLIPKMHVCSDRVLVKFDVEIEGPKTFPACVQAYGSICYRWSLILLGDGLDSHK